MTEAPNVLDRTDLMSPTNRPLAPGVPIREPERNRKCTDLYCLILFIFFNACLWTLSGWSYQEGDPQRLVHGWDVHGTFCGTGEMRDFDYTYFPVPMTTMDVSLCLPGCPVVNAEQAICLYDKNRLDVTGFGCFDAYPSRPFYNNYCLPADRSQRAKVLAWLYSQDQAWDELAIAGVVTFGAMMVFFIGFKLRCKGYAVCTLPLYLLSTLVLLFLFAVLTYLLHEENWRVNGQICEPFGPVRMDECEEGDTAHGYRDLAWVVASFGFVSALAAVCMTPRLFKGEQILRKTSPALGFHPLQFACPCAALVLGTSFYAYFITLLIFTVSTGKHSNWSSDQVPWGQVYLWEFDAAERVLVFFDVGMILWWFSFLAHSVEFVTSSTAAEWFFSSKKGDMVSHTRRAVHTLFRYHIGSVLLASVLLPTGRLLRNLLGAFKFGIRHLCGGCLGCASLVFKPCLAAYDHWFKYMTSDSLTYMAIMGESFIKSARKGYFIVKRGDSKSKTQILLNSGNMVIWLFQLVIMMSGVIFCAWWLQYDDMTFKDFPSFQVTSITAMAIYELFITWFFAQLYGAYVRGLMHTSVVAFLIDGEANSGDLLRDTPMAMYLNHTKILGAEADFDPSKAKDSSKVAPAPVVSEGLLDKPHSGAPAGVPQSAPDEHRPPASAQVSAPPATAAAGANQRIEADQGVGDDVEKISSRKPETHT